VGGRAKSPLGCSFESDTLKEAVKGEIEIKARLLAVRNHVEAGRDLVVNGGNDSVILEFVEVGFSELRQVLAGKLQPGWKRVTANHRRAKQWPIRGRIHELFVPRFSYNFASRLACSS
jgi:hypothetical protein